MRSRHAHRARLRLVVNNDISLFTPDQPSAPRATFEWCRNAPTPRPLECHDASSYSPAAEILETHQSPGAFQKPNHRRRRGSRDLIQMESCGDIKRGVYYKSNIAFNNQINALFRLRSMADRPIDRALAMAKDRGMNKSQFAKALNVLPQHVTNWIARGMPPEYHEPAADVLGCSVDTLLGRDTITESWLNDYHALQQDQQDEIREIVEDRIARFKAKGTKQPGKKSGTR
jgi:hypothetical protein